MVYTTASGLTETPIFKRFIKNETVMCDIRLNKRIRDNLKKSKC